MWLAEATLPTVILGIGFYFLCLYGGRPSDACSEVTHFLSCLVY